MNYFILVLFAILGLTQQYSIQDRVGNLHHYGRTKVPVRIGSKALDVATKITEAYNTFARR